MMKCTIVISIPLVWCIRNFILSGITRELEKRYEIFYAIPETGKSYMYCANHVMLTPDEPAFAKQIIQAFQKNEVLKSYTLVLRLHPMDDYDRWNSLLNDFSSLSISYPWPHNDKHSLFWGKPTVDDIVLFSNTLRHSSLVLNIASTSSIDEAILHKPIVCVGFSSDASNSFNSLYYNFHYSNHYAPIMKTEATPLSVSLESLVTLSHQALHHPEQLSEKRRQMVELLFGLTDGCSSERIVNFLSYNA